MTPIAGEGIGRSAMRVTARHLAWQVDSFCARLNAGLTAVAIVLAGLVGATAAERAMQQMPPPFSDIQPAGGPGSRDPGPILEIP